MRILLAEDEKTILRSTAELLRDLGYTVLCARNGEEVLQVLDAQTVDLVISDIRMPRMDGFQLLRALRAQKSELPVILITGQGDEETTTRAEQGGACYLLHKPLRVKELLASIRSVERDMGKGKNAF